MALRAATTTLLALVAGGISPNQQAPARSGDLEVRARPARAMAAVPGVQLNVFGATVDLGSSTASVEALTTAEATTVGLTPERKTTTAAAKVDRLNEREATRKCVPRQALFDLLDVQMTCGESRVQILPPVFANGAPTHSGAALFDAPARPRDSNPKPIDNGGPQAVGRGSEASVDVRRTSLLDPHVTKLRDLLDAVVPMPEQTLGAVSARIPSSSGATLTALALNMSLSDTDAVKPVITLLERLVHGLETAKNLATIKAAPSSTHANSDAERVVALAQSGGGQIDVLPGVAPGDTPLFSIAIGPGRSVSSFDRATAVGAPSYVEAATRMRLNLDGLGADLGGEVTLRPGVPITLLAGTPLETTVSSVGGRTVEGRDGSVWSYVGGVNVHALKGVTGGMSIRIGYAESRVGGRAPGSQADGPDRRVWLLVATGSLAATLVFLGYSVRRRRGEGGPRTLGQLGR